MPRSRGSFDFGGLYLPMINKDRPITGLGLSISRMGVSKSYGESEFTVGSLKKKCLKYCL